MQHLPIALLLLTMSLLAAVAYIVEQRQRIANLHVENERLWAERNRLRVKVGAIRREADTLATQLRDAQGIAQTLRNRAESTGCPCDQLAAAQQRIAYLSERNNQLTLQALANAGKIIRYFAD